MTDGEIIARLASEIYGCPPAVRRFSTAHDGLFGSPIFAVFDKPDGPIYLCGDNAPRIPGSVFNPLESWGDVMELQMAIPETHRADYLGHLECVCIPGKFNEFETAHVWALVRATPRQRCAAVIAMLDEQRKGSPTP